MKIRFTIARKLIIGFGIISLAVITSSSLTFLTLQQNKRISDEVSNILSPTVNYLNDLSFLIANSKMLIKNWVFIERKNDTPDKIKLRVLHSEEFPDLEEKINTIKNNWDKEDQRAIDSLLISISDTLFNYHQNIMNQLSSFEAYDDVMVVFEVNPMVEEGGEVIVYTDNILDQLAELTSTFSKQSETKNIDMFTSLDSFQNFIIILGIILVLTSLAIAFLTLQSIVKPINKLKDFLLIMTKGILPKDKMKTTNDEIGDMSEALNAFIEGLIKTSEFSLEIGEGNFVSDFKPLSNKDILGNSLLTMRDNLKKAEDEENKRKKEDDLRNWTTQGLAKFGDILRQNNDKMDVLSFNIMSNLLNYLNCNQGSIFIINDNDPDNVYYELLSAIAYNRKKFLNKKIKIGEGLIGRAAYEKLTILLTEIPEKYINITSGLGTANPTNLLIVPLKLNDEVFGVIELASFENFEQHHIEFVETLGETIASTISSVKINERTARLLTESRQKGEELASQEEEMRQNMEELQATQEESARKEVEMLDTIDAINNTVGNVTTDMSGNIVSSNELFSSIIKISISDLLGRSITQFISWETLDVKNIFNEQWDNLKNGIPFEYELKIETEFDIVWLKMSFTPFKNTEGDFDKIGILSIDISQLKELQTKFDKIEIENN